MPIPSIANCIGMDTFQTYLNDKVTGLPLAAGVVTFYKDNDRNSLKEIYTLSGAPGSYTLVALPNPNTLNVDGTLSGITPGTRAIPYFYPFDANGNAELYYITVYNSDNVLQETLQGFPPGASSATPSEANQVLNYVQNGQFLVWDHVPVLYGSGSPLSGQTIVTSTINAGFFEQLCDAWYFRRSNGTGTTDSFSQQAFTPGQTTVEGNPRYFLRYNCTSASGETYKRLVQQYYENANFLQGQTLTFSIQAKADAARTLKIRWGQNFGTGGSSEVISDVLATLTLTTNWNQYTVSITIPSTTGKTLGNLYDDYSYLILDYDLNVACTYDLCNVLLQSGVTQNPNFPYDTYSGYLSNMDSWWKIPTGQKTFDPVGVKVYPDSFYWLLMNDGTIGNASSGASASTLLRGYNLFCYLWTNYNNTACPLFTSAGAPVARGADPVSDWNANRRIQLPLAASRLMGAAGSGSGLSSRTPGISGGGENVLKPHTHTFTNSGALPNARVPVNDGANTFGTAAATLGGVNKFIETGTGGADGIVNLASTDSAGSGTDTMPPYNFFNLYIHF